MSTSSPILLAAVAGQQQKSGATAGRRAVLPFQLYDGDSASNCQVDLLDIEYDLDDTPPLIWDSDTSSDDIPGYLEWPFEEAVAGVPVSDDDDDSKRPIDMAPDSPSYQHQPFDYEPFSDSCKVRPYPDELILSTEENHLFHEFETGIFGGCSYVVPLNPFTPIATFSIADSAADTFLITFQRPINIGFPAEPGRKQRGFEPKIMYLGDL